MEDDGFTLVTGKKAAKNRNFKKTENGSHIRVDGSSLDIEKSMKNAKSGVLKSGLGKWLHEKLELLTEPTKTIRKIYLIGNGHFDRLDEPGAHQLALFVEISAFFNADIVFQEPACSSEEKNWLAEHKIEIREIMNTDIEIDEDPDNLSILAMIHGEHEILNSFLSFNWKRIEKSKNLIIIGNNYGGVNWELSKLSKENPKINEFFEKSIITNFPEIYEPHNSAFSSTVIMTINEDF